VIHKFSSLVWIIWSLSKLIQISPYQQATSMFLGDTISFPNTIDWYYFTMRCISACNNSGSARQAATLALNRWRRATAPARRGVSTGKWTDTRNWTTVIHCGSHDKKWSGTLVARWVCAGRSSEEMREEKGRSNSPIWNYGPSLDF